MLAPRKREITDPDAIDGLFKDDLAMRSSPVMANYYMDGSNGEEEEEQDGSLLASEVGDEEDDDEFRGCLSADHSQLNLVIRANSHVRFRCHACPAPPPFTRR